MYQFNDHKKIFSAKLNKYFANISSQFDWKTIEKEPKPWPPLNESHIKDAADKKHQIFINNLKRTFQSEFYPQKIHCEFSHENFSIITYKIYVTFEGTIYEGKMFTTFAANFDPITFNLTRSKDLKEYHIQHSNDAYKPVKLTSSPYNFSESLITEYIKNTSISIIHEILRQNSESFLQTDFCTLQKTSDNYTIQIPRLRAIDDGSSEWQNITIEGLFNYQSVNVMPHVGDDGIEVEVQFFTKTVTGSMVSSSNSTRFTFKIDRLLLKNNITEGTIYVEALDNILVDPPLPLSHNSKKELESIIANSIKNPPEVT